MPLSETVSSSIRSNASATLQRLAPECLATLVMASEAIRNVALEQGMIELRADGLLKAAKGLTSIEEIARVVK
jgi:type IV pilus assembly protein PilB